MRDRAPGATDLCDGKPFWADLVIWRGVRSAVDAWFGAIQKDVLKNFDRKVMETERENTKAVVIHELCGRPRRGMLLLIWLWMRESCRKRISLEGSCGMIVGEIAASGLVKDCVLSGYVLSVRTAHSLGPPFDENLQPILFLQPSTSFASRSLQTCPPSWGWG